MQKAEVFPVAGEKNRTLVSKAGREEYVRVQENINKLLIIDM